MIGPVQFAISLAVGREAVNHAFTPEVHDLGRDPIILDLGRIPQDVLTSACDYFVETGSDADQVSRSSALFACLDRTDVYVATVWLKTYIFLSKSRRELEDRLSVLAVINS
jgi:hypothetical protein